LNKGRATRRVASGELHGGTNVSPVFRNAGRALPAIIQKMMRDPTAPVCPIPGLGRCVRERCTFWDAATEECTEDCFNPGDGEEGAAARNPDEPCVILYYEDFD
jgi:hypothetical protein